MAPTVCAKNEPHVRGTTSGSVIVRDTTKLLKSSTNSLLSTSAVSNVGKIIHRRSVTVRSARSKLSARRLPDSESSSSEESDIEDYRRINADDKFPVKYNESFPSIGTAPTTPSHPVDVTMEFAASPNTPSEASSGCQCSDRLTSITGTTDSAYDSIRCRHCCLSNSASPASFAANDDDIQVVKAVVRNDIVLFNPIRNELGNDCASDYSTHSSVCYSDDYSSSDLDKRYYVSKKTPKNNRALLEIAVKTVKLIKRNQLLQQKLAQLQFETRQFFESVMANPENQNIHMKITTDERTKIEA